MILSGNEWKDPVKIVSVYTPVWLAYDKYAQWSSSSLSSGAELLQAPPADAKADEKAPAKKRLTRAQQEEVDMNRLIQPTTLAIVTAGPFPGAEEAGQSGSRRPVRRRGT